jgi:hypothetical protein
LNYSITSNYDPNYEFTPYDPNKRLIYPWVPADSLGQRFPKGTYYFISYKDSMFVAERITILP